MPLRVAAAECLLDMAEHTAALHTSELEGLARGCFRANNNVMAVAIYVIL